MKSLIIAFAMYSKFPMPRVDWEKKALSWALCWFPLVGLAVGAVLWLWLALAGWLGFGAVFTAALALLVFFAAWCEAAPAGGAALALALGPAFSRSLSGLFAVTLPNARGTGLLATFTGPMDAVKARGVLAAWAVLTGGAMVAADVRTGLAALVGAGLACVYYVVTARRQFGGVTGDLAGFFLQLCELGMVLCAAVGQRLEVLL